MKKKIIAFLLLFTIIAVGGVLVLTKSQEAMTGAQGILRSELSNALGSMVTIGRVELTSYNTLTIYDVTIYDKQAETLAVSEKITVTYNPLRLLSGQAVVDAIADVTVDKPTLWLTQAKNGRWNIQEMLQQENTKSSFSSKVIVQDGRAMLNIPGAMWTMEHINGKIDFAQKPSIDVQLQAVHKGAVIKAEGQINSQGRSNLTLIASELFVSDYQVLLAEEPLSLVGGSIKNLEVTITQQQGKTEWTGGLSLAGVDINMDGMLVEQIQGSMSFTNKNMYLFATGNLLQQPIDVRGSIRVDTRQPMLNLIASSTAFDPNVIANNLPFGGKLAFKAHVTGLTNNPMITGEVMLETGQIAGYGVHHAKANVQIMDKKLTINDFSAGMLDGQVAAAGTYMLEGGSYDLHLKAQQIDMANVVPDMTPNSYGDIDVMVKGKGTFAEADIQGTAAIGQGKVSGIAFHSINGGFYRQNGIITIDYANISLAQGLVSAWGQIEQQNMALTVYGKDIALQQLNFVSAGLAGGNGDFSGQITGTLAAPEFAGSFTLSEGQLFYQPFTQAKGTLHGNRQQIVVDNLELIDGVTTHHVQGTLALDGQHEINMLVKTHQARAENIVKLLAPGERLTGNVDNEMTLTGPLEKFNVQGQILLTNGSFRGQLIAKGQGSYKREQGTTTISQFNIHSLNTRIKLSGSISPNNELNFDMIAQHINMERINLHLPYPAVGVAQFTGKLTGTVRDPIFSGHLSADSLMFNNQKITSISGDVALRGNEIDVPYISFMQGTGKFGFAGGFDMGTTEIYGSLDVENVELQPILAVLQAPSKDMNAQLNGHIQLGGILENPTILLTGTLKNGKIKQYPIESIVIDIALENKVLKINDLSMTQGAGRMIARGTADFNGPLALEVSGQDIDAGLVASLLNSSIEPSGKIGFAAQISGEGSNPHAAISLEVANGGVGTATFDSLYGLLIVDKKTIHVNQVLLKKGPYRASAYGIVPVAALSSAGRQQATIADQMDLKIRLDDANLSILPFLNKQVAWAEGPTQGEINVTGTLEKPAIAGRITVNNGVVKLAALTSPIQKMGVDINFEGDTININKFEGHLGKGLYSLTGTAKIQGMTLLDYDLSLVLDKPELGSKYFTGPIDGNLKLRNRGGKPTLSGKLLFENDIINIPMVPDMVSSNLDIGLDIEMTAGKKVRFYNPYLYDILADGKVNFAGSTLEPDVTGSIVAVRGTINYLGTQFKVTEASVDFKKFASFEPIIQLRAQTNLQQVGVTLKVQGPISEMQFSLTSEPAMRQQEILSLLTLRSRYVDKQSSGNSGGIGRDEVFSILGAGLQMQFISQVEGNFRTTLGLDEFRLVKDTTSNIIKKSYSDREESTSVSQEVYNIEMSKYLTDKLLLSYTMGIDHDKRDLALRYSLSKHTSFNAAIDEEKRTWFGLETRFRF